jgi:hypothetical protein
MNWVAVMIQYHGMLQRALMNRRPYRVGVKMTDCGLPESCSERVLAWMSFA